MLESFHLFQGRFCRSYIVLLALYYFLATRCAFFKKNVIFLAYMHAGPGCSSIGYGAASELGPLRVSRFGAGLEFNKFAWNKGAASIEFVLLMIAAIVPSKNLNICCVLD